MAAILALIARALRAPHHQPDRPQLIRAALGPLNPTHPAFRRITTP